MIVKRYRNGKVITERLDDGSVSNPKVHRKVRTNPRGRPAVKPKRISKPKKKGCGCGKK